MAALKLNKQSNKKTNVKAKFKGAGALPSKRNINLAQIGVNKINYTILVPALVLIIFGACLFSKFAVVDRLNEMYLAQQQAAEYQYELDATLEQISAYGDIADEYEHYTYSGMNNEEINREDRMDAIALIDDIIIPNASVSSWSITGNEIDLTVIGKSLQKLNEISAELEEQNIVDFCVVKTVTTNIDGTTYVTGQVTVYLKDVSDLEAETETGTDGQEGEAAVNAESQAAVETEAADESGAAVEAETEAAHESAATETEGGNK